MDSETHDFLDGRGPVPVKRHPRGGGIVDLNAKVDSTAWVGWYASVGEGASVGKGAKIDPGQKIGEGEPDFAGLAREYRLLRPDIPVVENLDSKILEALNLGGKYTLDMRNWHGAGGACGTTHCRAGFAVHFAGEKGKKLGELYTSQTQPRRVGSRVRDRPAGRSPELGLSP